MKFRKFLAAGLAACSLLTLAACKSEEGETDWEQYKQEDKAIDSVSVGEGATAGTLTFSSIDSDSVMITGYAGPETPHTVTIPATVRTSSDSSIAPKKVTAIAQKAFHSLSNVKEVILPEGLTEIGTYAFAECKQLENVTIPKTLAVIGDGAFYGCSKLKSIGALGESAVTEIPKQCFAECVALTEVTIPANVKTVGVGAFMDCVGLTSVTLSEGVETLGDQCFMNASELKTLTLCKSLKNTDPSVDLTFYGATKLETVTVPSDASETVKAYAEGLKKNTSDSEN